MRNLEERTVTFAEANAPTMFNQSGRNRNPRRITGIIIGNREKMFLFRPNSEVAAVNWTLLVDDELLVQSCLGFTQTELLLLWFSINVDSYEGSLDSEQRQIAANLVTICNAESRRENRNFRRGKCLDNVQSVGEESESSPDYRNNYREPRKKRSSSDLIPKWQPLIGPFWSTTSCLSRAASVSLGQIDSYERSLDSEQRQIAANLVTICNAESRRENRNFRRGKYLDNVQSVGEESESSPDYRNNYREPRKKRPVSDLIPKWQPLIGPFWSTTSCFSRAASVGQNSSSYGSRSTLTLSDSIDRSNSNKILNFQLKSTV
ncbi:hypothetical protein GWI33_015459 [Rhynchophorus ferrugineus]|uniref:Uncharacterized protein n=1 Tax=Rhynchophorus ferrugineus TaxID=354439 RepID=A0A834HZ86_RHYFE|nr:hypothetical protein GWI33_015459 [Rhynchophorus ferrugineus]